MPAAGGRFSALQRAENSSILRLSTPLPHRYRFSALQRAENSSMLPNTSTKARIARFSALQRAENSSIGTTVSLNLSYSRVSVLFSEPKIPQSANLIVNRRGYVVFQCSSASRKFLNSAPAARSVATARRFSALQRAENSSIIFSFISIECCDRGVSVLFSEPKIPQFQSPHCDRDSVVWFQCSSASRKFLNPANSRSAQARMMSFSALQRAENSSIG